jgi:hypothetical protein
MTENHDKAIRGQKVFMGYINNNNHIILLRGIKN